MYYRQKERPLFSTLFMKIVIIIAGLLTGLFLSRIFLTPFIVSDNSMLPTMAKGDFLIISKMSTVKKGSIILFKSPVEKKRVLLKRVIAMEGDIISIRNKELYINNKKFSPVWNIKKDDPRTFPMTFTFRDNMPTLKLKRNEFFTLSDNFNLSFDSRTFGKIPADDIIGVLLYLYPL